MAATTCSKPSNTKRTGFYYARASHWLLLHVQELPGASFMLVAERDIWVTGGTDRGGDSGQSQRQTPQAPSGDAPGQPTLAWLSAAEVQEAFGCAPEDCTGSATPLLLGGQPNDGVGSGSGGLRFAIPVPREETGSLRTFVAHKGDFSDDSMVIHLRFRTNFTW